MHGMAAVNSDMVVALSARMRVAAISVVPAQGAKGIGYHVTKASSVLMAVIGIVKCRLAGARALYASADDGLGGAYTTLILATARIIGLRIALHHHSYRYIVERTRMMQLMVQVAGRNAIHVVLCDEMIGDFGCLYPGARTIWATPNSVARTEALRPSRKQGPLTIGMLANLTFEKGVAEFIEIVERALDEGIDVRGVLAGPVMTDEVKSFIEGRLLAMPGRVAWIGAVSGEAKDAFFTGLDLFIFPSKYRTESFGLVLLEALVRGVPIAAPRRGCVCVFESLAAGTIVPLTANFQDAAVALIRAAAKDREDLECLASAARQEGRALNDSFIAGQEKLADMLAAMALQP